MKKPNLFIVGKQKSGTTALYDMLRQHPEVYMPERKETCYFNKEHTERDIKKEKDYLELFKGAKDEKYIGEATASYLDSGSAVKEIKKFNPNARIIILLREPVDFLRSLYQHTILRAKEKAEIEKVLKSKEAFNRIKYSEQVKRYLENFPKNNIKVIIYEDMKKDNFRVFREVCDFLGIGNSFKPIIMKRNTSRIERKNLFSKTLSRAPLYKLYLFIDKHFPVKIKNLIFKTGTKIMFKQKKIEIPKDIKKELMEKTKPEVVKINDLLHKESLIEKEKDLIKEWRYE